MVLTSEYDANFFDHNDPQANDYNKVMSAFRVLDFSEKAVESIWSLVAAILHIGNMEFASEDGDRITISDKGLVKRVAGLLNVSENDLVEALTTRVIAAGAGDVSNERLTRKARQYLATLRIFRS